MDISCYELIPEKIQALVKLEHDKYEMLHGTPCNYTPFYIVAQEQGNVIGIVSGYTAYAEVYVDDIVVLGEYRGQCVGTQLLEQVYKQYEKDGFDNINLCTSEFQAPGFYEKCGFRLEFVRKNRTNAKLNKYFYVRYF